MLKGSTTSKTTLQTSLVLIWLDDSPYSSQSFDKAIDPTTDHEDQSMRIPSFFNTHTRYPLKWTKSDKLLSSNSQVVVWLNQLSQGYPTQILGERGGHKKPTWSRIQHSGQVTTWWYFWEDIRKIMNHRYVTKLENNLAFQGKTIWSKERWIDTILTHWSESAPEIRTRWHDQS